MGFAKRYGQSSSSSCPFCGMQALTKNKQDVPCCAKHKDLLVPDLKCICGGWLDQRESKFGVFYACMKCGPVSFSKMMLVNGDAIHAVAMKAMGAGKQMIRPAASSQAPPSGGTLQDRIRAKVARGEPLTPDELDFL